jgi:hypothetical protein
MKEYYVTFHYTIGVQAEDQEQADALAWEDFTENFGALSVGDFVSSEPEQQWWEEKA